MKPSAIHSLLLVVLFLLLSSLGAIALAQTPTATPTLQATRTPLPSPLPYDYSAPGMPPIGTILPPKGAGTVLTDIVGYTGQNPGPDSVTSQGVLPGSTWVTGGWLESQDHQPNPGPSIQPVALRAFTAYQIVLSGTYYYMAGGTNDPAWTDWPAPGGCLCTHENHIRFNGVELMEQEYNPQSPPTQARADHTYTYTWSGSWDGRLDMYIQDPSFYGDNSGFLHFDIYEFPSSAPTSTPVPTATLPPPSTATPVPQNVPPYSVSRYVSWTRSNSSGIREFWPEDFYKHGCYEALRQSASGLQDAIVILNFGAAREQLIGNSYYLYGTRLYTKAPSFVSTGEIEDAAKWWLRGYWICSNPNMHVTLAIGMTNQPRYTGASSNLGHDFNAQHGGEWANMVNSVHEWIRLHECSRGYYCSYRDRESVAGAVDMETWSTIVPPANPQDARAWAEAYNSTAQVVYYNFGSCDGCPYEDLPGNSPPAGWTAKDFWDLSWGVGRAHALPQIYWLDGRNAKQWRYLSYSFGHIFFSGTLTQFEACNQVNDPVSCPTNRAQDGWQQLYNYLNDNTFPGVQQTLLDWSTDIKYDPIR